MKKIIITAMVLMSLAGCKEDITLTSTVSLPGNTNSSLIPVALLNRAGESWKVAHKVAGGEEGTLTNVWFEPGGNFTFVYHIKNDVTVQVTGEASFSSRYGKNIFTVQPLSGIATRAGISSAIDSKELHKKYAREYLWEKVSFKDMPAEDFLLLVDMEAYPLAGAAKTSRVDRSRVSKFYSRK